MIDMPIRSAAQDISLHLEYLEMGMRVLHAKSATDGVVRKAYELFEELIQKLSLRKSGCDALADSALPSSMAALSDWHEYIMSSSITTPQVGESDWMMFLNEIFGSSDNLS